jgi:DNA-binding MarR family transcriptional regulator
VRQSEAAAAANILQRLATNGVKSIVEAQLLLLAAAQPACTVSDLAKALRLPMSSTSRMVFQLVKLGLLEYQQRSDDRRSKSIRAAIAQL